MPHWLDGTWYPDVDPPAEIAELVEQIDFLARLCGAWDFGVLSYMVTIREVRRPSWREAVDTCNLLTSPTYHLSREWHNQPYLGQ